MTNTIADALRAAIDLLSATRETFAAEVMLRQYDDVLGKLRAALQAAERNAEMLEAARELLALKEELEHPQPPSTQAEPVAWRITDGEGGYDYRDDPPEDWQVAWVARWGRKHEPLYTQPHPQPPSDQDDAVEALRGVASEHDIGYAAGWRACADEAARIVASHIDRLEPGKQLRTRDALLDLLASMRSILVSQRAAKETER